MIVWFNCTVLTDSFALSALIFMLLGLTAYVREEKSSFLLWIGIVLMYVVQALMRSDRTYSALVMVLGCILFSGVRRIVRKFSGRYDMYWDEEENDARKKAGIFRTFFMPLLMTVATVILVL